MVDEAAANWQAGATDRECHSGLRGCHVVPDDEETAPGCQSVSQQHEPRIQPGHFQRAGHGGVATDPEVIHNGEQVQGRVKTTRPYFVKHYRGFFFSALNEKEKTLTF